MELETKHKKSTEIMTKNRNNRKNRRFLVKFYNAIMNVDLFEYFDSIFLKKSVPCNFRCDPIATPAENRKQKTRELKSSNH